MSENDFAKKKKCKNCDVIILAVVAVIFLIVLAVRISNNTVIVNDMAVEAANLKMHNILNEQLPNKDRMDLGTKHRLSGHCVDILNMKNEFKMSNHSVLMVEQMNQFCKTIFAGNVEDISREKLNRSMVFIEKADEILLQHKLFLAEEELKKNVAKISH